MIQVFMTPRDTTANENRSCSQGGFEEQTWPLLTGLFQTVTGRRCGGVDG